MDSGCERYGYASDVTRCWPVNGRFSPEQAAVYEVVQDVHRYVSEPVTVVRFVFAQLANPLQEHKRSYNIFMICKKELRCHFRLEHRTLSVHHILFMV